MEAARTSETLVNFYQTTRRYNPEESHLPKMYKSVILRVVLCGCETWSFMLREEHRLRVFENRVPRRIFGPVT
jgi:hypothetical protein